MHHFAYRDGVLHAEAVNLDALAELEQRGATVSHVVCVIDRSTDQGAALAAEGLTMHALLTRAQLDAAEARRG